MKYILYEKESIDTRNDSLQHVWYNTYRIREYAQEEKEETKA
jgi:hypothetical protein